MFTHLLHRFSIPGFLLALWVPLICSVGMQWTVYEQYHYGWAVPFLCVFLLVHKWQDLNPGRLPPRPGQALLSPTAALSALEIPRGRRRAVLALLAGAALLVLPVRVLHEPNPMWRFTTWLWAVLAVALTLGTVYLAGGPRQLREFAFPIVFFLAAVPWVSPFEGPLVDGLSRANASVTVEVLSLLGVPALRLGNVIEIGEGVVGIEEACSGIRSVQSTFMLALFFGELYRLAVWRRVGCVVAGFGLAFGFNLCRTVLLTWVAARQGVGAVEGWHDPAGVSIVLACFVSLYGLVLAMRPEALKERVAELIEGEFPEDKTYESNKLEVGPEKLEAGSQKSQLSSTGQPSTLGTQRPWRPSEAVHPDLLGADSVFRAAGPEEGPDPDPWKMKLAPHRGEWGRFMDLARSICRFIVGRRPGAEEPVSPFEPRLAPALERRAFRAPFFIGLLVWLVGVEVSTELWYRSLEAGLPPPLAWRTHVPEDSVDFWIAPISPRVRHTLGCDTAANAFWTDLDGNQWLMVYVRWDPGRAAAHLAKLHTPEACLPAAGWQLEVLPGLRRLGPLDPPLPFRAFRIVDGLGRRGFVFYCRSGDRRDGETEAGERADRASRLRAIWKPRGNEGMTVLEIVLWGVTDEAQAQAALERELAKMIEKPGGLPLAHELQTR